MDNLSRHVDEAHVAPVQDLECSVLNCSVCLRDGKVCPSTFTDDNEAMNEGGVDLDQASFSQELRSYDSALLCVGHVHIRYVL